MELKRGAYLGNGVSAEADQLEAVLRARGIDPSDPRSWPIWDAWELRGLSGALDYLREEGIPPVAKKTKSLADLRERFRALDSELTEIGKNLERAHESYKLAQHELSKALDSRAAQIARAEQLVAKNQVEGLRIEYRRVAGLRQRAEIEYRNAENQVAIARANLQKLADPLPDGGNYLKLTRGDVRQLQRTNRAILDKFGVSETEVSNG